MNILGDGGEGGATLDYQVGGILSYQLKPNLSMQEGWRYLTVHYGKTETSSTERFSGSFSAQPTNSNRG